ncbi:SMN family protein Smn1 [Schizosaccharomyces octosporus yFS286]|uniref:SMN family protein Smn1 n=1 Tax=Schizosaccharomyces octosporus (strain yFS286) TaxID=483514 RepID=S9Q4M1_SCHOY|nr:SMN family protein Smn1 [Schizosaccharomyces octosporus yFS286]EPX74578.1 SMN family protein Smn1 [Schizosaccharomyces octosporus yFS286]
MNSEKEVWDDSELRIAYETALAEYKKYHSLEAEKSQTQVQPRDETLEKQETTFVDHKDEDTSRAESNTDVAEEGQIVKDEKDHSPQEAENGVFNTSIPPSANTEQLPTIPPPPPIQGLTYDETYRRLLMSWYYAGYYAGLAQGMHQSQS